MDKGRKRGEGEKENGHAVLQRAREKAKRSDCVAGSSYPPL